MNEVKINHLAAVVCIVFLFVLGFLWYDPLFGEAWLKAVGLTMEDAMANPPGAGHWITNTVSTIALVYLLAWLLARLGVQSAVSGLLHGALIAFVFILMTSMVNNMFAQAPYNLAWITGGFHVVGMGISGLILGAWTKK